MSKPKTAGILAIAVLAASLLSIAPVAAQTQAKQSGCFFFTINGGPISPTFCKPKANDIKVVFAQKPVGTPCFIQFTLNHTPEGPPVQCPRGANDVEVFWGMSSTGALAITKCTWTHNGVVMTASCPVPVNPSPNDFTFNAPVIRNVHWTLNGNPLGHKILAPPGTNDVEFFFQ